VQCRRSGLVGATSDALPDRTDDLTSRTAFDERERCMFVGDGGRCERRTQWLIGSVAELVYAYLCGVHLDFVRQPGQPAEVVEQTSVR
jgi:hypothetical protein